MYMKINVKGENADFASHILGKNPYNHYISDERVVLNNEITNTLQNGSFDFSKINIFELPEELKSLLIKDGFIDKGFELIKNNRKEIKYFIKDGQLIRKTITKDYETHIVFKKYEPTEIECILFTLVDSLKFSKDFDGYVNDKEYLVTSVFQTILNDNLGTALTKSGDGFDNIYDLTIEIGPFKPNISTENLQQLFEPLGIAVEIKNANTPLKFENFKRDIIFLTLKKKSNIRDFLRQVYILISAIDNFKHFLPKENDSKKFKKYSEGWLESHPLNKLITQRYLKYTSYSNDIISELNEVAIDIDNEETKERGFGENGMNLNELRLYKMKEAILKTNPKTVLDFGCGEGNLLKLFVDQNDIKITGVDSSVKALDKCFNNLKKEEKLAEKEDIPFNKPKVLQSSLYYRDSRLKGFDTIVLCEVIEHIEIERVSSIIDNIMYLEPKNLIISTPNKEFNKYIPFLKGELRFYDHRFEFTFNEFKEFCEEVKTTFGYDYIIESFGKEIDGLKPTMMATFVKGAK